MISQNVAGLPLSESKLPLFSAASVLMCDTGRPVPAGRERCERGTAEASILLYACVFLIDQGESGAKKN